MAYNGRYVISMNFEEFEIGAIIPALMHYFPSELHSQACLSESGTGMGYPLGSPRVTPLLIFILFIFI